jgi:pyruvate formate lyase activating enzyme
VSSMDCKTETRGLVFSIDRFVADDGPGIRTTVFLKGCPLKCIWCHSPQSQRSTPQLSFINNRCIGCGACAEVCPQKAQVVSRGKRYVQWEKCDDCGKCVAICPSKALETVGEWMAPEQVMDIIRKDMVYYKNSGGGVTFSGGEATAQPDFLISCLKSCRDEGIHTALDTCGFCKWSFFEAMSPYVNLFLYDLKHMDSKKHRQFTGVGNKEVLKNLRKLDEMGKTIWVRIPLVPGYTDTTENLRQTADFVSTLANIEKVSLLPYNTASGAKYLSIGKKYALKDMGVYPLEKAKELTKIFFEAGIKAEAGRY